MGEFLDEMFHLLCPPDPLARSRRASDGFADGLLHGLGFASHVGKLN
jgi:hypothetical protein